MKKTLVPNYPMPPSDVRRYYDGILEPGPSLAVKVLFALRGCVQTLDNRLAAWLGRDALTPGRLQVLMVLLASPSPIPQREIVAALKVSRATVSDLVEALRAEGHVTVATGAEDRRQVLVALTPTGRATTKRLAHDNADRLRDEFAGLSDGELRTLADLLVRLLPVRA